MNVQEITNKIATMQRAIKTATTDTLKDKLRSKIKELKDDLKTANIPTQKLAQSLLGSQRKVANYSRAEFKEAIKKLSKRDSYAFLKRYTIAEIEDDRERYAKPVGWRFKGRDNIKKPTAKELAIGKAKGTVYYESRPNRSDVVRPVKLAEGGAVGLSQKEKAIIKDYKEKVTQHYNSWIKKTKDPDLKKLYKNDLNDHLYVIQRMEFGSWNFAYKFWAGMDTASREETTNDAYVLLMEKNNFSTYAKGGEIGGDEKLKRIKHFLSMFPDNADSWSQATDEIRDLARSVKEIYNEYDLDVNDDDPQALKPLDFQSLKTPSRWNTEGKKYILSTYNKMVDKSKDMFYNQFAEWFDADNESMAKGGTVKAMGITFTNTFGIDQKTFEKAVFSYYDTGSYDQVERISARMFLSKLQSELGNAKNKEVMSYIQDKFKGKDIYGKGGSLYEMGGDIMPFEKYDEIHDEIHENKYDKGGSISNAVDKHIATRKACKRHGYTLDDYNKAHKQYAKGGKIGDSGIIEDPNSLYNGKMGTIVGEDVDDRFFLVKTTQGTGLVKKTRIKIIADDKFAKGGVTKKDFVGKKVGQVMHEFKQGDLHVGKSGKVVKKRKQAVAIALNVANEGWKHRRKK